MLNPDLRLRWYQLAVFPDSFDHPAAAALWEVQPDAAQDTLSDLSSKYGLIEWNAKRYRLHDLVRDFTALHLEDPVRAAAQNRHAAYYKNVLADADRLYLQGGAATGQGLTLFDTEWANIRTGQAWSAANAALADSAARLCVEYPDAGVYVLFLRLHPRERIGWLETAVRAARQLGNRQGEANALGNLGNAYYSLGEYRRAIEFHNQHLAMARELGDRQGEGAVLGNLGVAYYSLGEYRRAIDLHEQNLTIARELGDRHGGGSALFNGGSALVKLGKQAEAIPRAESGLEIFEQIESPDAAKTRAALAEWRNLK